MHVCSCNTVGVNTLLLSTLFFFFLAHVIAVYLSPFIYSHSLLSDSLELSFLCHCTCLPGAGCRCKLIEGKDSFILESCLANTAFSTLSQPFSRQNEVRVHQYLSQQCTQLLARIDAVSTDARDQELSAAAPGGGGTASGPAAMMARLRLQERAALRGTLQRLKVELVNLQVRIS
jgi:hypothetical protein